MGLAHHCREFNDMTLQAIRHIGIDRVVLAAYWSVYLPARSSSYLARILDPYSNPDDLGTGERSEDFRNFADGLQRTVRALEDIGVEVWILQQVPAQHEFVPLMLVRAAMRGEDVSRIGISLAEYRSSQGRVSLALAQLGSSVALMDPAAVFCKTGQCLCSDGMESFYHDSNHLTQHGAALLEPELRAVLH
jgi:SGNH domain (fused to AT3 domains)